MNRIVHRHSLYPPGQRGAHVEAPPVTPIIFTAVAAWALTQVLKVAVGLATIGKSDSARMTWRLIWAGGMPSSHAAFTASTLLMIGFTEGVDSPLFGLAFVLTAIVLHDRSKLHHMYSVFQERFPPLAAEVKNDPMLRDLVGHRTSEIAVGFGIGCACAGVARLVLGL